MNEFSSWMKPAHVADARAAVGLLPPEFQAQLHKVVPVVITGIGAGLNADDVLAAIRKYYPEITEALEALDEVPLMEEAVCPE